MVAEEDRNIRNAAPMTIITKQLKHWTANKLWRVQPTQNELKILPPFSEHRSNQHRTGTSVTEHCMFYNLANKSEKPLFPTEPQEVEVRAQAPEPLNRKRFPCARMNDQCHFAPMKRGEARGASPGKEGVMDGAEELRIPVSPRVRGTASGLVASISSKISFA